MTLRRATVEDLSFLLPLEQRFRDLDSVGGDKPATHERQMADADCLYYIVEENGERVGFVILRGLLSVNHCIELKRIVIAHPDRGIGRLVLHSIINEVFDKFSAHRLWLDVFKDNHLARHVYRSLGFIEEGTLRECIQIGGCYRSLVVMSLLETEYKPLKI